MFYFDEMQMYCKTLIYFFCTVLNSLRAHFYILKCKNLQAGWKAPHKKTKSRFYIYILRFVKVKQCCHIPALDFQRKKNVSWIVKIVHIAWCNAYILGFIQCLILHSFLLFYRSRCVNTRSTKLHFFLCSFQDVNVWSYWQNLSILTVML